MTVYEVLCEGYRTSTYPRAMLLPRPALDGVPVVFPLEGWFRRKPDAENAREEMQAKGFRAWIDTRVMPDAPAKETT